MEESFTQDDLQEMVLRLAHEIRNPLATIKSSVQLLQLHAPPSQRMAPHLERVIDQVMRIDRSVREMERFVSIQEVNPGRLAVADLVASAVDRARETTEQAGVRLVVVGGPELVVVADPDLAAGGLLELLANAVGFSPSGSAVEVWWAREAPGFVEINVDDRGCGVAAEHAARVLRPFFSTSTQGNGIGLNVVQRICRLHRGRLRWANRAGGGCRFTMVLPSAETGG